MFKRLIYEDWMAIVPIISFIATAGVFLFTTIRALCLSKQRCEHLASLPISDRSPENQP